MEYSEGLSGNAGVDLVTLIGMGGTELSESESPAKLGGDIGFVRTALAERACRRRLCWGQSKRTSGASGTPVGGKMALRRSSEDFLVGESMLASALRARRPLRRLLGDIDKNAKLVITGRSPSPAACGE